MEVSVRSVEGGFDWVGKYCVGVGSVTGALRICVGVVVEMVSVIAIAVILGMEACKLPLPQWDVFDGVVFGYKHIVIGLIEFVPGLKWVLEDYFKISLKSNPSH